jgi:hypothetical protein
MPRQLLGTAIAANTITTTQLQTTVVNQISAGGGPRVSSLIYPGNDTAGNTIGGQTVYINGSGFETNNAIYINGNAVPSKSFISASNLSFTTPALSAGIYPVYVINTDNGATAIFVPGYISSAEPAWATAAGSLSESQDELSAWSYNLSVTGDTPITYALAGGSSLPTGVSLAANGLISGTITSPSGNTTTYTFSVIATDAQNQDSTRQFTVTTSTGEGVLFANNVLLIHADGTNNQNNHAFLDSSNNNFTITRNGNATQGSFSPFSQTGWSGYFDGTTDAISFSSIELTSDFTIEAWIYPERVGNGGGSQAILFGQYSPNNQFAYNADGTIGYYNGSVFTNTATTISLEKWTHVAWVRSGSSTRIYINGANSAINSSDSGSRYVQKIGEYPSPTGYAFKGFISNARVTANALYSGSSFSTPTSSLEVSANTKLLTLKSNRFIDSNTTPLTITRDNDTKIMPFSPFAPTAAYSTANVGGSGYFDGTDDYLRITDNAAFDFGSGDFTIECWAYTETFASQYNVLVCQWGSSTAWIFRIQSTLIGLYANIGGTQNYTASVTNTTGQWDHFAVTRSGTTLTFYKNGVSVGTTSISGTINNAAETISIGVLSEYNSTTTHKGYISGLRVIKGSAIAPTITSPPTNIANTSLLCNFTNAGIFDQTAKNILETVGDAKVSTAQYKYGTGSMVFDGNGDGLFVPYNPNLAMSGNFTIEFWINFTSKTGYQTIYSFGYGISGDIILQTGNGDGKIVVYTGNPSAAVATDSGSTVNTSQWYHIAVVRNGSTITIYRDGVSVGSGTSATAHNPSTTSTLIIGGGSSSGFNNFYFNGYIDDLRVTKGYARYTSNFTPPTSALKDK